MIMQVIVMVMADGMLVAIVLLAAYALLCKVRRGDRYEKYMRVMMAGVTSYVFAKFIAQIWQPEATRPFEQLGQQAGASFLNNPGFPSDHTLFAMFLTLAVWYVTRSKWLAGAMFLMTILLAVGRVLALVHTPLDVIGGMVIACTGIIWYSRVTRVSRHKSIVKKANK